MISTPADQVTAVVLRGPRYSHVRYTLSIHLFSPSVYDLLQHGGVGVLCAKLLTIEVIDVAEEALTALDKLSRQHGYGRVRDCVSGSLTLT